MLNQIKVQLFHTDLDLYQQCNLHPTENSKIQGLFKASKWFSSTFQGRFNYQGLFKKDLNSSAYLVCVNPVTSTGKSGTFVSQWCVPK